MEDFDLARGLTALRSIQNDITDPKHRSEVIKIIQPYIESIYPKIENNDWEILKQELAIVSAERAEIANKLLWESSTLDYSNIEFAASVIKSTFLLAQFSKDGKVLDELEKLIKSFVVSADELLPNEEEIELSINKDFQKLKPEDFEKAIDFIVATQRLFIFDKDIKKEFSNGLSQLQLYFALEVLFVGMVDFYCQQEGPMNGLARSLTITSFADKEKGSNMWGYNFEQAYDRLNLIISFSKKHKEILDTMSLGAQILAENTSSNFKFPPLGLSYYLELPENKEIYEFFKTLKTE